MFNLFVKQKDSIQVLAGGCRETITEAMGG